MLFCRNNTSSSSTSKSFITNGVTAITSKQLQNPVSDVIDYTLISSGIDLNTVKTGLINMETLTIIEESYGVHLARKTYEGVSNNYNQYINLYKILRSLQDEVADPTLLILLQLAKETLVGAINAYELYGSTVALTLAKTKLQNTIDEILSNKNVRVIDVTSNSGQLSITKSFKLAPVFNAYIVYYGMPEFGVGFDPLKINFLVDTLTQNGIDPYK